MEERRFVFWQGIRRGIVVNLFLIWLLVFILEKTGMLVSNIERISLSLILAIVLFVANNVFSLGMYMYNRKQLNKIFTTEMRANTYGAFYYAEALEQGYLASDHHPDKWYKKGE